MKRGMARLRSILAAGPWVVLAVTAIPWAIAGASQGLWFFPVATSLWITLLVAVRSGLARVTHRGRVGVDLGLLVISFLAGWEGGIVLIPSLLAFVAVDLFDPTLLTLPPLPPIASLKRPLGYLTAVIGVASLAVSTVAAGMYGSATSAVDPATGATTSVISSPSGWGNFTVPALLAGGLSLTLILVGAGLERRTSPALADGAVIAGAIGITLVTVAGIGGPGLVLAPTCVLAWLTVRSVVMKRSTAIRSSIASGG
jgi:hypothetical protein